ncbi:MAG: glycosyltransferase family 2 protein [Enterococcus sp.]
MKNSNQYKLSSLTLISFLFITLFSYPAGILGTSISFKEQWMGWVFFIFPILYVVLNIIKDPEKLPKHIKAIGFFSISLFILYSCMKFIVQVGIVFGGEALTYKLWVLRFLPLIVLGCLLLISYRTKVTLHIQRFTKLILLSAGIQGLFLLIIFFSKIYDLYIGKGDMSFLVETPAYLITYLGTVAPLMYLVFLKHNIQFKGFRKNYYAGIFLAVGSMVALYFIAASGSVVHNEFNFETMYYFDNLLLNYGSIFASFISLLAFFNQIFIGILLYFAVLDRVNEQWEKPKRIWVYGANIVLILGSMIVAVYLQSKDMQELLSQMKFLSFTAQTVFVLAIILYGFYIGLKKYEHTFIKAGLYVFPSFVFIYIVYYLSKIWGFLPEYVLNELTSVQHFFLIVSLFVIFYYTLETILLWYAYSHRKRVIDLGPIAVEKDYDMYVMIPCMNEEVVIGNTLASILKSKYEKLHVIVIDDASEDNTAAEVRKFDDSRVRLIQRLKPHAQEGKGEALNYVYEIIKSELKEKEKSFDDVLIAIIDADTLLPEQYFEKINFVFNNRKDITGLQSKVRVISSTQDRSQDLEFAEIINATQTFRSMTGTVAFGGNGQFCKLTTLDSLNEAPWSKSLVEDFDLSTRLFLGEKPAKNIQLDDIYITQSGIDRDTSALVKQRVRWSQGNIQSAKYLLPIFRSKTLEAKQKFEFTMTLLKPWLMMLEYLIVIYTFVVILDLFLLYGMTQLMYSILVIFFMMLFYILCINFIWAWLYNRNKERKFSLWFVLVDTYYLTKFLLTLSQIYPQATIRHLKSESGWDKTKRQQNLEDKDSPK